jgi:hypothetical protein
MGAFLDVVKALRLFPRPYPQNVLPAEVSGGYYECITSPGNALNPSGSYATSQLFAIPFITREGGPVSSLAFYNSSAGETGAVMRLGIYNDNGGSPSTLVAAASDITLTAAAALREGSISATLTPNTKYWIGFATSATITAYGYTMTNFAPQFQNAFGNYAFRSGVPPNTGSMLQRSFVYGSLPASWGTVAQVVTSAQLVVCWKKT